MSLLGPERAHTPSQMPTPHAQPPVFPPPATWDAQLRALQRELPPHLLALFSALKPPESGRTAQAVAWRYTLIVALRIMLRVSAEERGLVPPPAQPTLPDAASWPGSLATPPKTLASLFGPLPAGLPAAPEQARALRTVAAGVAPACLGVLFERFHSLLPQKSGSGWDLGATHKRRKNGVFYTPPAMAQALTRHTLAPLLTRPARSVRIVDPAVGTGFFLLCALEVLSSEMSREAIARDCLYGVDLDPDAVAISIALLWLAVGSAALSPAAIAANFAVGDALDGPSPTDLSVAEGDRFSWRQAFPDSFPRGFDVVLSNPPWGRLRADFKAFHAYHDERTRDLQGTSLRQHITRLAEQDAALEASWEAHKAQQRALTRQLRDGGAYPNQRVTVGGRRTGGDPDAYKYFLERTVQLLQPAGRLGMILPEAWLHTQGATGLRKLLLRNGELEDLWCFLNKERLFPIHGMFRFAVMVWQRGGPPGVKRASFHHTAIADLSRKGGPAPARFSLEWLDAHGGALWLLPALRDASEERVFQAMLRAHPRLGEPSAGGWSVRFVRELDMTNDHHRFRTAEALSAEGWVRDGHAWRHPDGAVAAPLYEGRMVHQHDHAAKAYEGGGGRRARWVSQGASEKVLRPHYWVPGTSAADAPPRAGFCDITGHANARTVLAALIPAGCPAGNKVPTVRFSDDDPRLHLLWIALANSLPVDWFVRRLIDTTLNFFHWLQVPMPRLSPDSPDGGFLWTAAARLAAQGGQHEAFLSTLAPPAPALTPIQRAVLRAQIDARVIRLFGLSAEDVEVLLRDFPLLDRGEPCPITAARIRLAVAELAGAPTSALQQQVAAAEQQGAVGYGAGD